MFKQLFILTTITMLICACKPGIDKKENTEQKATPEVNTSSNISEDTTPAVEQTKADESKTIVAKVNELPIYKEDLNGMAVNKAVENEILYQEALKKGYENKYSKNVENFRRSLFINQLKSQVITDYLEENPVSEEEVLEYVEGQKDEYLYLKVIKVTINDPNLAQKIADNAKTSKDLKQAAASIGESSATIEEEDFSKNYNDYFKEKKVGEISDIIGGGEENVIVQILEIKELPTEQIARREKHNLAAKKKREAVNKYVVTLRKNKYKVEIIK